MGLFGYYAWHSLKNQIKKLFKTWVLVFFAVCLLVGVIIGIGAATLDSAIGEEDPSYSETVMPEETLPEEEVWDLEIAPMALVELIAGGVILACFVVIALGADKNGSKIFLPADVNLLFASPMQPQSVLVFRLATQLGTILLMGVYFLFQLPNFTMNLDMSVWAVLACIAAYCLMFAVSKLIQVLLYTVCSTHIHLKKHLRTGIYAFVGVLAAMYYLYWQKSGLSYLAAADAFFNSSLSRYIPFWGWIKGFLLFAVEGKVVPMLLCLLATVAGSGVLAYIIWHIKADFYEDAMAKSQETAELMEQMQSEKGTVLRKRKKDRSERLRRDAMGRGSGANVFFFKTLYNRFRFAHLHIFTKTSETYLLAALGVAALCRFVVQASGILPVALTLGVLIFYRALGNSLGQDVQMHYFLLVPEGTSKKLWYSLLGSTCNCLLDLLPAVAGASLLLGENILELLAWMPLLLSVDFFSTTAGTFITVSIPASVDKTLRQVIMVMFIYFGLLPDILIMAFGIALGHTALAAVGCALVNLVLGMLFFVMIPSFIAPGSGRKYMPQQPFAGDLRQVKRHFSRLGLGMFALMAVGAISQIGIMCLADALWADWAQNPWLMYGILILSQYIVALPVMLLVMKSAPRTSIEKQKLPASHVLVAVIVSFFMMYGGNLIGTLITFLLQLIPGIGASNPVEELVMGQQMLPTTVFVVIIGPIIEEFVCRKQLIDRMHVYGQKNAVIVSALLFGLIHGNFSQFFYAFGLGLVFGYLYVKSGKLRYSILLHMGINFMGGVVAPWLLEKVNMLESIDPNDLSGVMTMLPWLLGFMGYAFLMMGLAVAGLVLLIVNRHKIQFSPAVLELPAKKRLQTVWCNVGMVLMVVLCLSLFAASIL